MTRNMVPHILVVMCYQKPRTADRMALHLQEVE